MDVVDKIVKPVLIVLSIGIIAIALMYAILPVSNQVSSFAGNAESFNISIQNSDISFKAKSIGFLTDTVVFYSGKNILIEYKNNTEYRVDNLSSIQIDYDKTVNQSIKADVKMTFSFNNVIITKDGFSNSTIISGELNKAGSNRLESNGENIKINNYGVNRVLIGNKNITDFKQISFEMRDGSEAHFISDEVSISVADISELSTKKVKFSKIAINGIEGELGLDDHEFNLKKTDDLSIEISPKFNSVLSIINEEITFDGTASSARLNNKNIIKNDVWYMLKFKPEKINAYATLLLAFITILYVVFTGLIVEQTNKNFKQTADIITESKKERKIAFIMKRLEEFYYPLDELLKTYVHIVKIKNDETDVSVRELRVDDILRHRKDRIKIKNYQDTINHQYLAEKDTKVILDTFLGKNIYKARTTEKEYLDCHDELVKLIENDICKLRENLGKLLD